MNDQDSENFGSVPNVSEAFGNIRNDSETFRRLPNVSERKENHTLTARDVTRMFEERGVARTERSIINWCHPDKHGISRLDCFFDANERKYFITPQSVELAIKEEQAKSNVANVPKSLETPSAIPNPSETARTQEPFRPYQEDLSESRKLKAENRQLKFQDEVNKRYIKKLEEEREASLERMLSQSHRIGALETEVSHYKELPAPRQRETTATPATEQPTYIEVEEQSAAEAV